MLPALKVVNNTIDNIKSQMFSHSKLTNNLL